MNDDRRPRILDTSNDGLVVLAIRLVCLGLLGYWTLILIRPFLTIMIWSAIIAVALYPIFEWLSRALYGFRVLAAIVIATVSTTDAVNSGVRFIMRNAYRMSVQTALFPNMFGWTGDGSK